jgi:hypothetical protein
VAGAIFGGVGDEDCLAGKTIECCYVRYISLAIGRCAGPCSRAGGEAHTTTADTTRRSYRRSLSSRVIATAAATTPSAHHRTIIRTRCAEQGPGSDKRLIKEARVSSSICQGGGKRRRWRYASPGGSSSGIGKLALRPGGRPVHRGRPVSSNFL